MAISDPITGDPREPRSGENHNNILQAHRWLSNIDGQASGVRSGLKISNTSVRCRAIQDSIPKPAA
jgi:hypothetical protein